MLDLFLVSTYLFVRCNNHKCVIDLCEEVTSVVRLWPSCLNVLWTEVVCSWLILVQVPLYLILEIPFVFLNNPMAASSSNKMECPDPEWALLQAELLIDQVDWDLVKTYLFDRFSTPPSSYLASQGQTVIADVHSTRVCEHIMHLRPCPSFFDASYHCQGLHPEFLLQGMDVIWTPRTWCCRAFQRRIDLTTPDRCHVPGCQQLHRPGWAHCELVAFRAWALRVDRSHWFTIYCRQPNVNGKLPLYIVHYQDIVYCFRHQGYLPYASFIKHSWKETVEPPLTYLHDYASLVKPFAANYYDDERVQQRRALHRQRSQTPRRPRPEPSQPATTADNFLQQNEHVQPSPVPPHFGTGTPPRSRQPTGSSHQHQPSSFPTPKSNPTSFRPPVQTPYDNRPTPITNPCSTPIAPPSPAYTQTWPEVPADPWAEDSDGLQPPPADLRVTAPPNWQPSTALQTSIRSSHHNFFTQPIPRAYYRDFATFLTGGEQFAPFANWQMPTRLLEDTFSALCRTYNDPSSSVTMTWWGMLSRQTSLHPNQQEYSEQALTIPLPTNTADPEVAILTSFFYTKMNQERAAAFQNPNSDPLTITKNLIQEWLSFAGDQYRLSLTQRGCSARFNYNVATVILDLLSANIPEHQRIWADSDPNINVDPITGKLQFHLWTSTSDVFHPREESLNPGDERHPNNVL